MKLFDKPKPPYIGYNQRILHIMREQLDKEVTVYSIDIITGDFDYITMTLLNAYKFLSDATQIKSFYFKDTYLYVIG